MKKTTYAILIICFVVIIALALIILQNSKNTVSDKKKLSNILGIEFSDRIIIKNIKYTYSDNDYTHIFLYVQVDKKYADQVSYFKNNGNICFKDYYTNFEKNFYEAMKDPDITGKKILFDNSVFPEGVDISLLPKARGVEGYSVLVFGIDEIEDKNHAEFLIEALIPAKLKIKLQAE